MLDVSIENANGKSEAKKGGQTSGKSAEKREKAELRPGCTTPLLTIAMHNVKRCANGGKRRACLCATGDEWEC